MKKRILGFSVLALSALSLASCGGSNASSGLKWAKGTSNETIIKEAAAAKSLGNWGIGNEYEIYALLQKYDLKKEYVSQAFTMDSFDDGTIALASAMIIKVSFVLSAMICPSCVLSLSGLCCKRNKGFTRTIDFSDIQVLEPEYV